MAMLSSARLLLFTIIICAPLFGSGQAPAPYAPSHEEMLARYRAAAARDSAVKNTIVGAVVNAHWMADGKGFWYRSGTGHDSGAVYVEAGTGKKRSISGEELRSMDTLFRTRGPHHQFNEPPSRWESFSTPGLSPDKRYNAYIEDNNVFIKPVSGGEAVQYTKDGSAAHPYGSLAWSPDSKYVVGYHITPVEDSPVYYVLSSVPGTTRGQLRSHPYKQPGDPFTTYEMYVFAVGGKTPLKVNTPIIDFFDAPFLHWTADKRYFLYEKVDRGHQRFRIIEVDAENGSTRTIVDEQTKTFIYTNRIYTCYLPATHEILWVSEKDGWRHLYLVDPRTGVVRTEITRGNYAIRDIDSVDEKKREIWFSAGGMNTGEDPYYLHYYRIGFDGGNLVELTPAHANHSVVFSPDKKYYLDTYSAVNIAPVTELRLTATGKKITEVERADISAYLSVVKHLPQPFVAKGRDGVTDIWGIFCVPAEFDSSRCYPIIENIYAGPQDAYCPKSFMGYNREMQSLADLGFIVVSIDGMGTAYRSKAFHDVCWKNLADGGFADRILWMKALAKRYPFVDSTRVGLYGTSAGGQNAVGGLLFHPEFYKAGVAACGCQDNRIDKQWWNEQWMGYPVGPHYAEQSNVTNAWRLSGDLLLIVGEADENVPPESTYRVIDALIKAKKTFDFFPVPGMGHGDGGVYGRGRKRDFFVKHLLGAEPPNRNRDELTKEN